MSANSPEKQYAKHIAALQRRADYLADKDNRNSYDKAEQSALEWVLFHTSFSREDIAHSIDSVESHEIMKRQERKKGIRK